MSTTTESNQPQLEEQQTGSSEPSTVIGTIPTEPVYKETLPSEESHGILDTIKEKASTLVHTVAEAAGHLKENVVEKAQQGVSRIETAAEDMSEKVKETVTETLVSAKDKVKEALHLAPKEENKEEDIVIRGEEQLAQERILQQQATTPDIPPPPPAPSNEELYGIKSTTTSTTSGIPRPPPRPPVYGLEQSGTKEEEESAGPIVEEMPAMITPEEYTLAPVNKAETLEDIAGVDQPLNLSSGEVKLGESLMIPSFVEPSDEDSWHEVKTYHHAVSENKANINKQIEQDEETHSKFQQHQEERQKILENNPLHPFDLSLEPSPTGHVWPQKEATPSEEVAWQNPEKTRDIVNTLRSEEYTRK